MARQLGCVDVKLFVVGQTARTVTKIREAHQYGEKRLSKAVGEMKKARSKMVRERAAWVDVQIRVT